MRRANRLLAGLPLLACIVVAGCANPVFYNEARDKQGQALGQAVKDVDLVTVVDGLDKKFAALRQMEADTMRARQATNRNLEIAKVASPGPDGVATLQDRYVTPMLDNRIERLVGQALDQAHLAIVQVAGRLALLTQQKATAAAVVQLANQINSDFAGIRAG